ncbi:MAG: TonB-dependent receptor plug domain-containing protein [Gemmatimonadota bacterium]|nr:TonB-dependent receptor plug domain-containing protein [Gemmatimonadota bacterium]
MIASRTGLAPDSLDLTLVAGRDTTIRFALAGATELESVVISSTRGERRIEDEPLRVEVISREEVDEKLLMTPGDIAMLLNETSGLRVQTTSPSLGGATVRIQGLGGRYTQLLSDGLPLYGGQTGGLGLLQIPPMDLGGVEVIKGAASAFYGAQALGGVVNLISRRPGDSPERELLLNRTSRAGTDAVVFAAAPVNERLGYTLLAGVHHQVRQDVDNDGWTDLAGYRRLLVRPRLFWTGSAGRTLFVTAGLLDETREGGTLSGATAPNGLPYREALSTTRFDVGAAGRTPVGSSFLSARFSFASQQQDHRFGPVPESDSHGTGFAEVSLLRPGERVSTVLGAALSHDRYANANVSGFDFVHTTPGLFALIDLDPTTWLAIAATARVDAHSEHGATFTPRLSALLRASETSRVAGWTARLSGGSGIFAPSALTEETEVTGLTALVPLGTLTLERATTASLDLGGPLGAVEVNLSLFGAEVRDPLATAEAPPLIPGGPTRLELLNVDRPTRTLGTEVLVRHVAGPWHVTASYAVLRATQVSAETGLREDAPLVPRQALGIVGMYEIEGRGRIGLEFYYTGTQALEHNPYRLESPSTVIIGALVEHRIGPARLFLNLENITDVRLTRHDPLLLPTRGRGGRWTTDAWTELAGRTINGGVRLSF